MEAWLVSYDGSRLDLPAVLNWEFSYGVGSPCDSFTFTCLWEQGEEQVLADAVELRAVHEGETVFRGRVDEYACIQDQQSSRVEISGRGMQCLLLDNESLPMEYQLATAADVIRSHVAPYGIETVGGKKLRAAAGFVVTGGQSQWSVVKEFAGERNGVTPYFDRQGRLVLSGWREERRVLNDKVPVIGLRYERRRYGVLSEVVVRDRSRKVTRTVNDEEFTARGGCRRQVITTARRSTSSAMQNTAEYRLKASRAEEVQCVLTLPQLFTAWPGDLVEVARTGFGGNGTYRAAEVITGMDEQGCYTRITLGSVDLMV